VRREAANRVSIDCWYQRRCGALGVVISARAELGSIIPSDSGGVATGMRAWDQTTPWRPAEGIPQRGHGVLVEQRSRGAAHSGRVLVRGEALALALATALQRRVELLRQLHLRPSLTLTLLTPCTMPDKVAGVWLCLPASEYIQPQIAAGAPGRVVQLQRTMVDAKGYKQLDRWAP
jgi:hypothetical protein